MALFWYGLMTLMMDMISAILSIEKRILVLRHECNTCVHACGLVLSLLSNAQLQFNAHKASQLRGLPCHAPAITVLAPPLSGLYLGRKILHENNFRTLPQRPELRNTTSTSYTHWFVADFCCSIQGDILKLFCEIFHLKSLSRWYRVSLESCKWLIV